MHIPSELRKKHQSKRRATIPVKKRGMHRRPEKSLRKSLRLPRTFPLVARWLFDEPHLPFHTNGPLLTAHGFTASVALNVRDHWRDFGSQFDPFQVITPESAYSDHPSFDNTQDDSLCANTVVSFNSVLTPVTFVTSSVVVGYFHCSGGSFENEELANQEDGTFKGRTHILGRFAYDKDNDHIIMVVHGISPTTSGIVDITSNGCSRIRVFYTVVTDDCTFGKLPFSPLTMVSNIELRVNLEELFSETCLTGYEFLSRDAIVGSHEYPDVRLRDGNLDDGLHVSKLDDNMFVQKVHSKLMTVSCKHASELMEISTQLNNLSFLMTGTYKSENVRRVIPCQKLVNVQRFKSSGALFTEHMSLSRQCRREVIANAWQLYSTMAFGMRSERRQVMLAASDGSGETVGLEHVGESEPRTGGSRKASRSSIAEDAVQLEETSGSVDESRYGMSAERDRDKLTRTSLGRVEKISRGNINDRSSRIRSCVPKMNISFLTE